jgi:hypothetical protein
MISSEKMQILLAKARTGMSAYTLCGRTPSLLKASAGSDKTAPISTNTLRTLLTLPNPECRELKELLDRNSFRGRRSYRWTAECASLLATEAAGSSNFSDITRLINDRFGADFTVAAVMTKANKLGIIRHARRGAPRLVIPKLAPPTTVLRFSLGSLLDRINSSVPRHLARDHRDDVIGEMALAVYEGQLMECDIERRAREFVNAGYRREHNCFGAVSLDVPLFEEGKAALSDTISNEQRMWA